ncbi:MAG: DUF2065 family protein [Xanthomonadales bacterium]|nr:DUF2065 domain-containing protein [Xanthomonadales bacterium]NIX12517.1 DUF2065 family protein [Xanthomonadales bacterium]
MVQDLLTAVALLLILEGLIPGISPTTWLRMMQDAAKLGPRGIRIIGISSMLAGALLLNFLR